MRKIILSSVLCIVFIFGMDVAYASEYNQETEQEQIKQNIESGELSYRQRKGLSGDYEAVIVDEANLLSETEEENLLKEMLPITEYGDVLFVSVNDNPNLSTAGYAENVMNSCFGYSGNGIVFVIDMEYREIYIYSRGNIYEYIAEDYAYTITDNVYTYASKGQYYKCASLAYEQVYTVLEGGRIAQPMKYTSNYLLALVMALLINFFLVIATSRKRTTKIKELQKGMYNQVRIYEPRERLYDSRKVYVSSSSGSGGRSRGGGFGGGGFGGGGGFSGGGGGHRF